ncbi:MAG: ribonuclease HII, partial [Patescibacteria group bacterium]
MRKKDSRICGIDEAGRGAWAGPLIAAAIVLPFSIKRISRRAKVKVKDGKLLTSRQRKRIYGVLKRAGAQVTLEIISARSINNHGIGWANREIMRRLIKRVEADKFIVDGRLRLGRILGKTTKVQSIAHADATIPEVILAGIVAKVERDKIMQGL